MLYESKKPTRRRRMKNMTIKVRALIMALVITALSIAPQATAYAAPNEIPVPAVGIDVSHYQGLINWDMVAASGVQFAMIRVAYRAQATGILSEDQYARYNLQEANRVGIKAGAYVFSSAVTPEEVTQEALFAADILDKYKVTFPVVYDCEGYRKTTSRHYGLDKTYRTALALIFFNNITARGYTPMFYASKNDLESSAYWDMSVLNTYKVWAAWYSSEPFPITPACSYTGPHVMWQYTNAAVIPGINGAVDMNVSYFNYDAAADAKDPSGAPYIDAAAALQIQYTEVNEVVTPNVTDLKLRSKPGAASDDTIVVAINPGDMIMRVAIGNDGWSKVVLADQTLYAYSAYLTKVL